jgi:hypothetical protein
MHSSWEQVVQPVKVLRGKPHVLGGEGGGYICRNDELSVLDLAIAKCFNLLFDFMGLRLA